MKLYDSTAVARFKDKSILSTLALKTAICVMGTIIFMQFVGSLRADAAVITPSADCGARVANYNYQVPFGLAVWNQPACNLPTRSNSADLVSRLYNWGTLNANYNKGHIGNDPDFPDTTKGAGHELDGIWNRAVYYASEATTTTKVWSSEYQSNLDASLSNTPSTPIPWNPNWKSGTAGSSGQLGDRIIVILDDRPGLTQGRIYGLWGYTGYCNSFLPDRICTLQTKIGKDAQKNIVDYRTYEGVIKERGIGLSRYAMVVTPEEVAAGEIRHAIGLSIPNTQFGPTCTPAQLGTSAEGTICGTAYIPASQHEWRSETNACDSDWLSNACAPYTMDKMIPEGTRFVLDMTDQQVEDWIATRSDLVANPARAQSARIYIRAMRDYGLMVVDTNGSRPVIQSVNGINSAHQTIWESLGMGPEYSNGGDLRNEKMFEGLFNGTNMHVVEPPVATCNDGSESKYYSNLNITDITGIVNQCNWVSAEYADQLPPPSSAPTINSFTTQSDTAHAQDTILLVANVTDPDNDINKVDLELDGTVISSKSSSQASGDNYSFSFDTTTKSNGTYTLKAKAYDSANPAHSAEKTLTITIDNQTTPPPDTEPPVIQTLISSNGSDPAQGTIQIQAQNVTDPDGTISKIELYLDNETTPYNLSSNCSVTGCKNPQYPADASGSNYTFKLDTTKLTNGSHTFKVKVYDSADPAHSAEKTLTTTIDNTTNPDPDTTKPTITSIEPAAGSNTTVTSTLTIKANGVSDDSGEMGEVSYRITGNNIDQTHLLTSSSNDGNYSAEMNVKTLNIPDGNYTITVIAKDAAGNTSDIKTFTITVNNTTNPDPDTTKPTITTTEPAAGSNTTVTSTLTIKANGVSDDSGEMGEVSYRITGNNIDQTHPLTSSSNDGNYSAEMNIKTLNIPDGNYTITVIAKDAAGNTSDIKTFTITVNNTTNPDPDTTKPTITTTEPAAGSTTTVTGTLTIKANGVSDDKAVDKVIYRIDNATTEYPLSSSSNDANYSATLNTATLNNGTHTITVIAKDAAGNTSDIKTFTITVNNTTNPDPDTTKPTITSTEPAAGSTTTVTGTLTIKANGVSDDKAVASVGYTIDGGSLKPMSVFTSSSYSASLGSNYSATIDTTTLNNGDHTIVISAKDTSNNTSDLKTFTIKVSNSNSNNNNNNSGSGSNTSNNTANQNPTNVPVVFPPQTGVNILGATLQQTDYYINDEFIGSKLGQENLSISDVIFNTRKLQPGDYDLKTIGKYTDGTVNVTSKIVRVFSKSLLGKYQAPVLTSLAVISLASGASYITHNHRQKAKKASR
jgi:hypothetical protein